MQYQDFQASNPRVTSHKLAAEWITAERFSPYGQLIMPAVDGQPFSSEDAQLVLASGTPRFYIMRLQNQGQTFGAITRHQQCTQCLGSLQGQTWLMAVAPPSSGDLPDLNQLKAFKIPGTCFVKLHVGTWHAGPYFVAPTVDFYNLELSDTNLVDHFTYSIARHEGYTLTITEPASEQTSAQ